MTTISSAAIHDAEAEAISSLQRATHDTVRQLHLGRAISYARIGSIALRLPELGRIALVALDDAATAEERSVTLIDPQQRANTQLPSALIEAWPIHTAVLAERPKAKATLLFRGRHLAGWAVAGQPIPVRYFQMFNYTSAQHIPVAAAFGDSSDTKPISDALDENPDAPGLLLGTGDTVIWARAVPAAARMALSLEEAAQVTAIAEQLGGAKPYAPGIGEAIYAALAAHSA